MNAGNRTRRRKHRGFSMVEAVIAALLAVVGIVASMRAIGALTFAQSRAQTIERLQRLAYSKYQELVSTGDYVSGGTGNFQDDGLPDVNWECQSETTGFDSVVVVRVTVSGPGREGESRSVAGVVYEPPTSATTGVAAQ